MITNVGKSILGKYLIGQAQDYASYIAIGCGPNPIPKTTYNIVKRELENNIAVLTIEGTENPFKAGDSINVNAGPRIYNGTHSVTDIDGTKVSYQVETDFTEEEADIDPAYDATISYSYAGKTSLDFEMERLPIISRGYISEDGVSKIVLSAQIPTNNRYEISEIGVYSAESNTMATLDSTHLFTFSAESWQFYDRVTQTKTDVITPSDLGPANDIVVDSKAFFGKAEDSAFQINTRSENQQRPRFLDDTMFISGDISELSLVTSGSAPNEIRSLSVDRSASEYVVAENINLEKMTNASETDEIRMAFSVVSVAAAETALIDNVKILVRFASNTDETPTSYADWYIDVDSTSYSAGTALERNDFVNDRYYTAKTTLKNLTKSDGFSWKDVKNVQIYTSIKDSTSTDPSPKFLIALDGLRFENTTTFNPLYGMVAYTTVANNLKQTIVKKEDIPGYIEFRFAVDVF